MEKCKCGWQLPLSVLAYSLKTNEQIIDTTVKLVCPRCEYGHQFFNAADTQSVVEYLKKKAEDPPGSE